MNDYWPRRKHLPYYQRVIEYAQRYCPDGKTLLDVGGGVGYGCRFLESLDNFERTSVELPTEGHTLEGVRLINEDFLNWEVDRKYDLVLCMQVLEHIPDVVTFARKLFECGSVVITLDEGVRMPAEERDVSGGYHVHDNLVNQRRLSTTLLAVEQVTASMKKPEFMKSLA